MGGEHAAYEVSMVGEADLGDLARLRTDWFPARGHVPPDDFAHRMRDWWDRQAGQRHAWLVRDEDDEPVAMANVQVFERMPRPGLPDARWAYVANVWVDPEHRKRGVGTDLMAHVIEWCRAEGMQRIVLNPSEVSMPLYEGLGFRPAEDLLRLDL